MKTEVSSIDSHLLCYNTDRQLQEERASFLGHIHIRWEVSAGIQGRNLEAGTREELEACWLQVCAPWLVQRAFLYLLPRSTCAGELYPQFAVSS